MNFNEWWDADALTMTNPYREDSPAYWAWEGWQAATAAEREACAAMLDAEADRQEREWNEYLASGKQGPATSLHGIARGYAAEIRKRSNDKLRGRAL